MITKRSLLFIAWKRLIRAYVFSAVFAFVAGTLLVKIGQMQPERIFEVSTKRLAYALPIFEWGIRLGFDMGILLFVWNAFSALILLSFIHATTLFDPDRSGSFPRIIRQVFCGRTRMKLLCHLPGCASIEAEPLRRVWVWLMVPLLSIILLGLESGLQASTAAHLFGSLYAGLIALLPHGVIEIPTLALGGAVAYSAHLFIKDTAPSKKTGEVFRRLESFKQTLPIIKIACLVIGGLFLAGLVEAHVTPHLMRMR